MVVQAAENMRIASEELAAIFECLIMGVLPWLHVALCQQ